MWLYILKKEKEQTDQIVDIELYHLLSVFYKHSCINKMYIVVQGAALHLFTGQLRSTLFHYTLTSWGRLQDP